MRLAGPTHGRTVTRHLGQSLTLVAGTVGFSGEDLFEEALLPGLKIVVVLSGRTSLTVAQDDALDVAAPSLLVILTEETRARRQVFAPDEAYRYVLIDLSPELVGQELGDESRSLLALRRDGLFIATRPADKTVQALAAQILACSPDPQQNFYRLGKALELTALALDAMRPRRDLTVRGRLSAGDVDRVATARDILVDRMASPPDIGELAAEVGLNPRKLNLAFRKVFGATPYAFLQEQRLQSAYRLLASGEATVAACAHRVGYAPTHLATVFLRRFGVAPSALISRSRLEAAPSSNRDDLSRR
jgi:AraC family transcriptional activator of pyochelin receptor